MMESRIFVSTFFAIISAALPLGARMIGTWPMYLILRIKSPLVEQRGHTPIVATTLNNPLAIRSISLSIWSSAEEGEFKMEYEESSCDGADWPDMGDVAIGGGGKREYNDADGAMKERY
jgi:hypothetical protein